MQNIYTKQQIKQIDMLLTEKMAIPAQILMENAAHNTANKIINYFETNKLSIKKIAIFCGVGNNGGDGLALARHLTEKFDINVFCIGTTQKMSKETFINYEIIKNIPKIIFKHINSLDNINELTLNYDCIIDSIIGIGGSENLRGIVIPLLEKLNSTNTKIKIAIDIPTGLNADNCKAHINTFKADITISITGHKLATINKNCSLYCGQVLTTNLNTGSIIENSICNNFILEENDIKKILSERKFNTSKFDYGKILVIAGSKNMCGAATLTANAAIKSGAGIVTLLTPKIHSAILPEIIAEQIDSTSSGTIHPINYNYLLEKSQNSDVIIIGPGIGNNDETINILRDLIFTINKPMVIDADALRCLKTTDILRPNIILTPHSGEFARLINVSIQDIENNPINYIQNTALNLNCTILLKTIPNIISDGNIFYWNINGNPGMATAGSGDVLSGIIGTMLAKNLNTTKAAALAALIHSLAGDIYMEHFNQNSLTASNIIEYLKYVI